MKKLLLLPLVLFVLGCKNQLSEPETRFGYGANDVFVINVKGHDYVIYDGYCKGGIVHAESCPCKQNKK